MIRPYLFCIFLLLTLISTGWADENGLTPIGYVVTIKEIDFYNSTTGQWVTAGTGSASFDIAAVGSGQNVGNYISGYNLPSGTYTQMKITLARTMQIKAYSPDGYYTTSATIADPNGGDPVNTEVVELALAGVPADASSDAQLGSVHAGDNSGSSPQSGEYSQDIGGTDNFYAIFSSPLFTPFTFSQGTTKVLRLSINLTGILSFVEGGSNYAHITQAAGFTVTSQ